MRTCVNQTARLVAARPAIENRVEGLKPLDPSSGASARRMAVPREIRDATASAPY
jgi:hypothetical protein